MKFSLLAISGVAASMGLLQAQVIQTEPNDSIGTATPSTLSAGIPGGIFSIGDNGDGPFGPTTGNSTGDFDFFSVNAGAGQTLVVDVNSNIDGTGVDTVVGIYNSVGTLVASNDDDGISRDSFVRFTVPAAGNFYPVIGNWVASAADDAGSLPTNPNTPGTGRGAPGGTVDAYEVVVALDPSVFFSYRRPVFPLNEPDEQAAGDFALKNEGNAAATITGLSVTGAGASAFVINQALPLTVAAGATATIGITFEPAGSDERIDATIRIESNDIIHPIRMLPVTAKAISDLLFRLPFDDPAGSPTTGFGVPAETSGNGFGAAMVVNTGAPAPVFGRPPLAGTEGFSTMFNDAGGSGNYVLTANGFPHTATFTYAVWVRPTAGSGEDTLFNRDPNFGVGDAIYGCNISPAGVVNFRIAGSEMVASAAGAVLDDTTHHVVVTHLDATGFGDFQADRTRLYIDGVMVAENTAPLEVPEYFGGGNSRLWIATRSAAGTGFNGDMDDFQLYRIELDPLEVMELYENPGSVVGEEPRPPFQITGFVRAEDRESVDITFNSRPNRTYILQSSVDLIDWEEINDSIASQGTTTTVTETTKISPTTKVIYYRFLGPG